MSKKLRKNNKVPMFFLYLADENAIIIGPNVPILRFRADFLPGHLEPGFPGAPESPKNGAYLNKAQNKTHLHWKRSQKCISEKMRLLQDWRPSS